MTQPTLNDAKRIIIKIGSLLLVDQETNELNQLWLESLANDIAMLEAADLGVAFCAKPALRRVADICIEQPDLSLLLPELKKLGLIS